MTDDDDSRAPHVEDAARVFFAVYDARDGALGFASYDRDANVVSLSRGAADAENFVLSSALRMSVPDVVYCTPETKTTIGRLVDASRVAVVDVPRRLFPSVDVSREIIRDAAGMSRVAELASRVRVFENDAAMIAGGGLIHAMKRNEGLAASLTSVPANVQERAFGEYLDIDDESLCAIGVFVPETEAFRTVSASCERFSRDVFQIYRDSVVTSGGKKLLETWFKRPLLNLDALNERFDAVRHLAETPGRFETVRARVTPTLGAHALLMKLSADVRNVTSTKRDWVKLCGYLDAATSLNELLVELEYDADDAPPAFRDFIECCARRLPKLRSVVDALIDPEEIYHLTEDNNDAYVSCVRAGACVELDDMRRLYEELPRHLEKIFSAEMRRVPRFLRRDDWMQSVRGIVYMPQTGYLIQSATILAHSVAEEMGWRYAFGDFDAHYYESDVCLRAAEAFGDVLSSIVDLQDALLRQLRAEVLRNATFLRDIERCVSEIDCLLAYADVARRFDMRRPELVDDDSLRIERARHPLYQSFMDHEFIPNDIEFAADGGRVKIITGANGSGKTAVIQTVGVIVFLAHVGSFVPASSARIGLTDRVFTSIVGFKDDPERKAKVPESGFTYALHAVSRMIHNATRRSLCLIDEFGTSTRAEDGCALLTAIVEYIASRECVPKMMVTTHFREMCDIIGDASPMIEYLRTAVVVNANDRADASLWREDVTMLFRLEPGVADSSFALNMCRLIGMPKDFIDRFTHLCERDAAARRIHRVFRRARRRRLSRPPRVLRSRRARGTNVSRRGGAHAGSRSERGDARRRVDARARTVSNTLVHHFTRSRSFARSLFTKSSGSFFSVSSRSRASRRPDACTREFNSFPIRSDRTVAASDIRASRPFARRVIARNMFTNAVARAAVARAAPRRAPVASSDRRPRPTIRGTTTVERGRGTTAVVVARAREERRGVVLVARAMDDDGDGDAGKGDDEAVANISRKVARTARACKSLGRWAFWSQLVLTTVAAVIVVFSFLYKGLTKSTDAGLYFILFGLVAGYFTTFWSLGVVRLGDKLRKGAKDLDVVPPRTDVIRTLSTGVTVNVIGLGATIVGLQATTGMLFAKTLTAAAQMPMYGAPVVGTGVALDIFLVQAASNSMLAHWFGLAVSLWLLRTVNLPSPSAKA